MKIYTKGNKGFSKNPENRPQAKRPYEPVTINSIQELVNLKGYIHSNIDNFSESYEKLNFKTPLKNLKTIKNQLIKNNKEACETLAGNRTKMEENTNNQITRKALEDTLKKGNEIYSNMEKQIYNIFSAKTTSNGKEWTQKKVSDLLEQWQKIKDFIDDLPSELLSGGTYENNQTRIEAILKELEDSNKNFDIKKFERLHTEKLTYSEWIVQQITQALGVAREPITALAISPLFNKVTPSGNFQKLDDLKVEIELPDLSKLPFGLNIKSSAINYINQTDSHKINLEKFWGTEYQTKYLPSASLLDYAFWNMISLRKYGVSNQRGLQLPDFKENQKEFLGDVLSIYQLVYLYSVMVTHAEDITKANLNTAYIKQNPQAFTQPSKEALENYYIFLSDQVFNTDEVYSAMIAKYKKSQWADVQTWIVATGVQANTLKELHNRKKDYIKEQVAFFGRKEIPKTRSQYITYQLLRDDPTIAKYIEDIYKKWSLSKEFYYVKYKVNINQLLNIKTK